MFTKRIIQFSTLAGVDSHEFFMEKYFTSNKRRTFTRHCSSRTFPAVYHTENFQFKPHINAESASFSTPCKPPSQPGFKRIQFNINSVLRSNTFSRINLLPKWAANKTLWLLLVLLAEGIGFVTSFVGQRYRSHHHQSVAVGLRPILRWKGFANDFPRGSTFSRAREKWAEKSFHWVFKRLTFDGDEEEAAFTPRNQRS